MKLKYFLLIACLLCNSIIYSQTTFKSLFEKYENEDDVTIVCISKSMFNLIPGNISKVDDIDIQNILPKIESLIIITSDKSDVKEKMVLDFKSLTEKNKKYEELMRIREGKSKIFFYGKKEGDIIKELIMLVDDEDDFVAIQILGNFTLNDVKQLTKDKTQ